MDRKDLLFLLRDGHIDMPTRIEKKIWPHPELKFNECVKVICDYLEINKYFPVPWLERKNGELIGDLVVIEKKASDEYIYRYRYSNPINLHKISEAGEKIFNNARDAVAYYLYQVLHLPGDLDGWKVVE